MYFNSPATTIANCPRLTQLRTELDPPKLNQAYKEGRRIRHRAKNNSGEVTRNDFAVKLLRKKNKKDTGQRQRGTTNYTSHQNAQHDEGVFAVQIVFPAVPLLADRNPRKRLLWMDGDDTAQPSPPDTSCCRMMLTAKVASVKNSIWKTGVNPSLHMLAPRGQGTRTKKMDQTQLGGSPRLTLSKK